MDSADQVPIVADEKSQAFTNLTATLLILNRQCFSLDTLLIPNEKSTPCEASEPIYYRKF
jgi:hypothetical protein